MCPAVLDTWSSFLDWVAAEGVSMNIYIYIYIYVEALSEHFFNPDEYHLILKTVLQKQLGLDSSGLTKRLLRLASC